MQRSSSRWVWLLILMMMACVSCARFRLATDSQRQAILQVLKQRDIPSESLDHATVTTKGDSAEVYYWRVCEGTKTGGWTVKVELAKDKGQWLVRSEKPYTTWRRKLENSLDSRCVPP